MSCGKPHGTPCDEVLAHLYEFLDDELAPPDKGAIRQHLSECGPCLREYGLEETVKQLVSRCCQGEHAPVELHQRVLLRIAEVRAQIVRLEP